VVKAKLLFSMDDAMGHLVPVPREYPVKVDIYFGGQVGYWRSGELIYSGVHRNGDIIEIPEPPEGRTYRIVCEWAGEKPFAFLQDVTAQTPRFTIAPDGTWHIGGVFTYSWQRPYKPRVLEPAREEPISTPTEEPIAPQPTVPEEVQPIRPEEPVITPVEERAAEVEAPPEKKALPIVPLAIVAGAVILAGAERSKLPPRGTGLRTGRAGERRAGKPRSEEERRARHAVG